MIKFFRQIRQTIIMENSKSARYFKYAIGEIILVVIGILIALQINNWNESKKRVVFEKEILKQIEANLKKDRQTLRTYAQNGEKAVQSTDKILSVTNAWQTNDSIKYWLGDIVRFDRFRPLTNAFEVLKSKGIDQVSNKQLQFLLGTYYDDESLRITQACKDLEIMFIGDWIPILKKNVEAQNFGVFLQLADYEALNEGGEVRNLLILNKVNWNGSVEQLKNAIALVDTIINIIQQELDD
ncbi:DUF6090 family protein [Winogradskyella maritima]|uniref:DUF6090 family protein n=1 Tax=Winogradskyella maritima TaxID=1517766 RepID=A0ABV8AKB6_9FLAO|nr:DUF6090 family protein [Winogradskyella maritima]